MDVTWKDWFMKVWEENRWLTDKITKSFVDAGALDKTPVPGMRSFRQLLLEIWGIEQVYAKGLATEEWNFAFAPVSYQTCDVDELLAFGQRVREQTRSLWSAVTQDALTKPRPTPFPGHPEGNAIAWLTYALENEIHHRAQGYVYLRLLGVEPPAFYVRNER